MEDHKERNAAWLSVPQFGEWNEKGVIPDYSLDFSKIRENRKQNKRDPSRASLGNEDDFISSSTRSENEHHNDSPSSTGRRGRERRSRIFSYFICCVKA